MCWASHPGTRKQPTCCISIAGLLLSRRFKKAAMLECESFDFYISLLSSARKHSGRLDGISSLFPGRLYGSSRDSGLVLDGGCWVGHWDSRSLCNIMPSFPGILAGWCGVLISVIVGSGDGGKALGIGVSIMGVLSFLRNLRFRRVILLDLATLILYRQLGSVSTIHPAMSHRWLFGFWMETASLLQSGDKACAVRLYLLTRSWNGSIMGLNEYPEASWFTRPNQDLASVMVLGTGKFKIALNIDSEGDTPSQVICNPPNWSMIPYSMTLTSKRHSIIPLIF